MDWVGVNGKPISWESMYIRPAEIGSSLTIMYPRVREGLKWAPVRSRVSQAQAVVRQPPQRATERAVWRLIVWKV